MNIKKGAETNNSEIISIYRELRKMTATADAISKYTAAYYAIILGFFLTNFIVFPRIQLSSAAPVFFFRGNVAQLNFKIFILLKLFLFIITGNKSFVNITYMCCYGTEISKLLVIHTVCIES